MVSRSQFVEGRKNPRAGARDRAAFPFALPSALNGGGYRGALPLARRGRRPRPDVAPSSESLAGVPLAEGKTLDGRGAHAPTVVQGALAGPPVGSVDAGVVVAEAGPTLLVQQADGYLGRILGEKRRSRTLCSLCALAGTVGCGCRADDILYKGVWILVVGKVSVRVCVLRGFVGSDESG